MTKTKLKSDQIKANPNNPRFIKDDNFKKLVQSLKNFPEMADVREVVVNKDHVILGGNMRYRAMLEAGWDMIPVVIVDWSEEKQREFIIKDNVPAGEWDFDVLANEWDSFELESWGLELKHTKADSDENEDSDSSSLEPTITIRFDTVQQLEDVLTQIKEIVEKNEGRISVNTD